jgi:hypothetical protein
MQPAAAGDIAERAHAVGEQHHRQRGGPGEAGPRGQRSGVAGVQEADGNSHLAGGRSGQELAERHHIRIGTIVEPAPPGDELVAKIAEMRNGPAERRQAEAQESCQHVGPATRSNHS